ncbi:hypothetical protein A3A93_01725 [Candidatus Roizmanbacteria bacterium RIFCSPLOWO2_01_FULL_38_12]|uniref:Iron permease n=1 Tax=Candidatus Roizmanbacteria bacterium RIFCSPLOWO2_01_FULL_38_12 TaxID=1802061 RepID=A0A1F7IYB6_9BACT|nr:MAG: hypothetical protein A2861_02275 [Candidatus Roizmanbacteria bacterium RIFCSPHIGHO2_01_FULL_38_15]OGK34508.1 MAG: hypothetical protein A3F59_04250 [Candidatus Roizmanbacteria bacterium RIFCSPHIGHO2_12_FULL_38_13]OGK48337.1 MAG: hypothetical protein A3A93_01725 [Candidatus Roizmanbacteria bacterium RIFCSPLOWO2_01_FULL_38_12]
MIPSFLITFREIIEASLIVATIAGILVKLNQKKQLKTVWLATGAAALLSVMLLVFGTILGIKVQEVFELHEALIEGTLMVTTAIFITWAVFFLHNYFGAYKARLLQKIKNTVERQEQKGLFVLVFTSVFREGFEIVLFLSTIYFSSSPERILTGFVLGTIGGLILTYGLFTATVKLPVYQAFRLTSILLILFAAGLLGRGVHEFAEIGFVPELGKMVFGFLPAKGTFTADMLKALFGITQKMDYIQIMFYSVYVFFMTWWVFFRKGESVLKQKAN